MKTIVVSDTHLTAEFDKKKYNFLYKLFSSCDKLIVNGDFWSCYSFTFDEFLTSQWKGLFPIMQKKKTTYIYGNHDRKKFMDHRINIFSLEQKSKITFVSGNNKYHIEHGNLFFRHQSISSPNFMKLNRKLKIDKKIRYPLGGFLYHLIGSRNIPKLPNLLNKHMENKGKNYSKNGQILVTGHSHSPKCDKKLKFINTGFINHGFGWFLEIEGNNYELKSITY